MTNSKLAATFHGADDLTPEQDLRAAVAERIADAIHFNGCISFTLGGEPGCTCLVGRLQWAINAEQVTA
ncbi:hypothetical protein ACFPJ1_40495 [Kribbella qitaiheensis]|uniref:hypothetical protein n=1 Tax=Kribbella qitaiheensis TaxID=1544730 RepID=UPI00361025D7